MFCNIPHEISQRWSVLNTCMQPTHERRKEQLDKSLNCHLHKNEYVYKCCVHVLDQNQISTIYGVCFFSFFYSVLSCFFILKIKAQQILVTDV